VPDNVINPELAPHHDASGLGVKPPAESSSASGGDAPKPSDSSRHLAANHMSTWQTDPDSHPCWPPKKSEKTRLSPMAAKYPGMNFLNSDETVRGHILVNDSKASTRNRALAAGCIRANATEYIWWDPSKVRAAMVTCGGLCPGLNSIIKGLTICLWHDYGVRDIVGVTAGYNGLAQPDKFDWIELNPKLVREIHMKGGSILKAGRGGFDAPKICETLRAKGINVLFVIGGDGTQFAGHLLFEEAKKQQLPVSVVGVPKSIDNDVLFVDRTFGFDSAVEAGARVIANGYVEATSCAKGVGIVKLMGRDAGFVAAHAALASNLVDLVLVPEVTIERLEDIFEYVDATLQRKGHMVIVVAEGAMQEYVATGKKDATGHTVYGDIGIFMRDTLNKYLKPKGGRTFYIDPSYIIRSVPITPNDHIYCTRLANNAAHTAMRGYSGVCVGAIHNVIVILKSKLIASGKKQLKIRSSTWQSCVQSCKMPVQLTGIKPKA
jgi:6-phosphofructokinase 1